MTKKDRLAEWETHIGGGTRLRSGNIDRLGELETRTGGDTKLPHHVARGQHRQAGEVRNANRWWNEASELRCPWST